MMDAPSPTRAPNYADAATPVPKVVDAIHLFADASHDLAKATQVYLEARDQLNAARERFSLCQDNVVKEREQFGV